MQAQGHLLDGAVPHGRELSLAVSAMTGGALVSPLEVVGFEQYDTLDVGWFCELEMSRVWVERTT